MCPATVYSGRAFYLINFLVKDLPKKVRFEPYVPATLKVKQKVLPPELRQSSRVLQ
jgi:hypothetical protein